MSGYSRLTVIVSRQPATRRWAISLWTWLLVAMVLTQSLGLMHNIVHGAPAQVEREACALQSGKHESVITGWVAGLFAAHHDESDCRLYDQFSHGDGVPTMPLLCLPSQELPRFLEIFEASLPSMPAALVQARGPPSVR